MVLVGAEEPMSDVSLSPPLDATIDQHGAASDFNPSTHAKTKGIIIGLEMKH
jgi:hypothetical protein